MRKVASGRLRLESGRIAVAIQQETVVTWTRVVAVEVKRVIRS